MVSGTQLTGDELGYLLQVHNSVALTSFREAPTPKSSLSPNSTVGWRPIFPHMGLYWTLIQKCFVLFFKQKLMLMGWVYEMELPQNPKVIRNDEKQTQPTRSRKGVAAEHHLLPDHTESEQLFKVQR